MMSSLAGYSSVFFLTPKPQYSAMTCQLEICCLYNEPLRRNSIYIYQYCM